MSVVRFVKSLMVQMMAVFVLAGLMPDSAMSQEITVLLDGSQQVPPVATSAAGEAAIRVSSDKVVTGEIRTIGIEATAAHIHTGAAGVDGPIIITFTQSSENTWTAIPDSILTDDQFESFKAGNLYLNVHSDAFPDGEIRGQIIP